jgi:hypothetical protein
VKIADLVLEEEATNEAKNGITYVAMERRHRTWRYTTPKSIPHHEFRASA